jgi:AcrR family transcriptional regulator
MNDGQPLPLSLRQRKKQRLRAHIAEVAARLFAERGFDAVSVAEIARAAEVAENTVFNYFPTKEDLFFYRQVETEEAFSRVIRTRARGESLAAALRRDFLEALEREDPRLGLGRGLPHFWRVVHASPRLQARLLAIAARAQQRLADELYAAGLVPDRALAQVVASLATSVVWALQGEGRRRISEGESVQSTKEALRALAARAFDLLEHGLGDLGSA